MTEIFPSITPTSDKDLTASEVVEDIFDGDHKAVRMAAAVVNDQYDYEVGISGRSTKIEIAMYLANNLSRDGVKTVRDKARERMEQ